MQPNVHKFLAILIIRICNANCALGMFVCCAVVQKMTPRMVLQCTPGPTSTRSTGKPPQSNKRKEAI